MVRMALRMTEDESGSCGTLAGTNQGYPQRDLTALELLQRVYRDPMASLSVRMRAAALALPFEVPKLSAVAMSNMSPAAFAAQLDRAIDRANAVRVLPPPTIIDAESVPED
jgi:hypothetical protein